MPRLHPSIDQVRALLLCKVGTGQDELVAPQVPWQSGVPRASLRDDTPHPLSPDTVAVPGVACVGIRGCFGEAAPIAQLSRSPLSAPALYSLNATCVILHMIDIATVVGPV